MWPFMGRFCSFATDCTTHTLPLTTTKSSTPQPLSPAIITNHQSPAQGPRPGSFPLPPSPAPARARSNSSPARSATAISEAIAAVETAAANATLPFVAAGETAAPTASLSPSLPLEQPKNSAPPLLDEDTRTEAPAGAWVRAQDVQALIDEYQRLKGVVERSGGFSAPLCLEEGDAVTTISLTCFPPLLFDPSSRRSMFLGKTGPSPTPRSGCVKLVHGG